jgi:hypothetical protein
MIRPDVYFLVKGATRIIRINWRPRLRTASSLSSVQVALGPGLSNPSNGISGLTTESRIASDGVFTGKTYIDVTVETNQLERDTIRIPIVVFDWSDLWP